MRVKRSGIYALLIIAVMSAACGGQRVNPQPLTPAQQFALAKIGLTSAVVAIDLRIGQIADTPANAVRLRILRASRTIIDEFNHQVADISVIDLSTSPAIKEAIKRGLDSAQRLTDVDVLELGDSQVIAQIRAGIAIARSALESFAAFLPATTP